MDTTAENAAPEKAVEPAAQKTAEKKSPAPKNEAVLAAQAAKRAANKDALQTLRMRFAVFNDFKPLAVGILDEVQPEISEFSRTRLRRAVHAHVHNARYLKAVAAGGLRYHLDGSEAGEISAESVEYSKECLKTLKEKTRKKPHFDKNKSAANRADRPAKPRFKKDTEKVSVANKDAARLQKLQLLAKKFGKKA